MSVTETTSPSGQTTSTPGETTSPAGETTSPAKKPMSRRRKIIYGIVLVYVVGLVAFGLIFGVHEHKNNTFNIVSPCA